jgi:hypothetical protein
VIPLLGEEDIDIKKEEVKIKYPDGKTEQL